MHPIRAWLAQTKPPMTVGELARRSKMSRVHLGRLMRGFGNFNSEVFERLEAATGGELTAVDLFAHYQQQRAAARKRRPAAEMAEAG